MKQILMGGSDFKQLMTEGAYFVDKSLLIKEFLTSGEMVTLITRPRRWGKSLNISMLCYFLMESSDSLVLREFFKQLKIAQEKIKGTDETYIDKYQGKFPVILLSLKDIEKEDDFTGVKDAIALAVSDCCEKIMKNKYVEDYLIKQKGNTLVEDFYKFLRKNADKALLSQALNSLSRLLYEASSGKKVYILIDEYDHPLNRAFDTPYFEQLSEFMKTFFSAGLKDNSYLARGLMTGVLRLSQSSMLSGLNNLRVHTVLDDKYSTYFGFTEDEVNSLLVSYNLEKYSDEIKSWYNGYRIGGRVIYNPWSIMNCVKDTLDGLDGGGGGLVAKNYWVETGANELIQKNLAGAMDKVKEQLQLLSQPDGQLTEIAVDTKVRFAHLTTHPDALWSLLLATGYLTAARVYNDESGYICDLRIPNKEVRGVFKSCVQNWLAEQNLEYLDYWRYLVSGKVDEFGSALAYFIKSSASSRDAQDNQRPLENFYHGFMLGLSFGIKSHIVKSNIESGRGYYDLLIKPKEKKADSLAIILEFKVPGKKESLPRAAQKGLEQALAKEYVTELEKENYSDILVVGISFLKKEVRWAWARGKNSRELKQAPKKR